MKKAIALFFTVLMLVSVMSACGNSSDTSNSKDSSTSTSAPETTSSSSESSEVENTADGGVIKVWIPPYKGGDAEYTDEEFWNDMFDSFEAENNCTVEVTILPWSGYMEKVTTGIASGEGPDVVYLDTYYDLASEGALEPLDSYFTDDEIANYYYWDMGYVAGGQYVLPMMVGNATVLYCNMDILGEAGITEVPSTWDDVISYCKTIKEAGVDVTYTLMQPWGASAGKSACMTSFLPYFWQAGGDFVTEDGTPNLDSEAGHTTVEFLYSLYEEGIYDDTIVSASDPNDVINNGEAAMVMLGTGAASSLDEAGINWDYTILQGPDGDKGIWVSGDSLAIPANSTNKEMAAVALKYMTSAEVMDKFHEEIYSLPPITADATYTDNEVFKDLFENETDNCYTWPAFENSDAFYDVLFKNIQSMYMGDLTPDEVIENTMEEYNATV